jgi:hypothetical protein
MSKYTRAAEAVKQYLVNLAANNELPSDLTQLDAGIIESIIVLHTAKSPRQQCIKNAKRYLIDDDVSIEDQIDFIAKLGDDYDLIDNIPGVTVWEKVELTFTCKDFLEEINYIGKP